MISRIISYFKSLAEFTFEKFMMRFAFLIAIVGFAFILFYAFVSTSIDEGREIKAEFAEIPQGSLAKEMSLDAAHVSNKELEDWIAEVVSEMMSFDAQTYNDAVLRGTYYFTPLALQQFEAYIDKTGILPSLRSNGTRMAVIVDSPPIVINSNSEKGTYRWLLRVPITISFLPRNGQGRNAISDSKARQLNLQLQVKRVDYDGNKNAVLVESWAVKRRR